MNLEEIWQKIKDLWNWDNSQLYYMKDKRAFNQKMADGYKEEMDKAQNVKQFNKAKFMFEQYQDIADRADCFVRSHDFDATEDGWRDR